MSLYLKYSFSDSRFVDAEHPNLRRKNRNLIKFSKPKAEKTFTAGRIGFLIRRLRRTCVKLRIPLKNNESNQMFWINEENILKDYYEPGSVIRMAG
jgi:hypothetical protein